jgi:hypothetical protein
MALLRPSNHLTGLRWTTDPLTARDRLALARRHGIEDYWFKRTDMLKYIRDTRSDTMS